MAILRARSICHNSQAISIISQMEYSNLNHSLYASLLIALKWRKLGMCHFEELIVEESILQILTLHLQTDRSDRPVLTKEKRPQSGIVAEDFVLHF